MSTTNNEKMTMREFFTAVANAPNTPTELCLFAKEQIEKLDKRNSVRKEKPSKTELKNAPLLEAAAKMLAAEPNRIFIAAEAGPILTQTCGVDVSPSLASYLLRTIAAEGGATVTKVKSTSKSGGKCNGYQYAEPTNGEEEEE